MHFGGQPRDRSGTIGRVWPHHVRLQASQVDTNDAIEIALRSCSDQRIGFQQVAVYAGQLR